MTDKARDELMKKKKLDKPKPIRYNGRMKIEVKKFLSEIGKKGGSAKSRRKTNASRINGRKGGRPKKKIFGGKEKMEIGE